MQQEEGEALIGAQSLALSIIHGCVVVTGGEVRCWGDNRYGQLGDDTTINRYEAVRALQAPSGPALTGVQALSSAGSHSCVLTTGGGALCWGYNFWGQLGDETALVYTPTPVLFSR